MLRIRFFRIGKKNQPSFKLVVTDKRRPPRGGRFVEEVGAWNPLTKEKKLKGERIKYWISAGAKPSDTVYNLLLKEKILEGKKIPVHKIKKEGKKEAASVVAPVNKEKPKKEESEKPKETKPEIVKKDEPKKEVKEEKPQIEIKEEKPKETA